VTEGLFVHDITTPPRFEEWEVFESAIGGQPTAFLINILLSDLQSITSKIQDKEGIPPDQDILEDGRTLSEHRQFPSRRLGPHCLLSSCGLLTIILHHQVSESSFFVTSNLDVYLLFTMNAETV
jgi:hypothetical protein